MNRKKMIAQLRLHEGERLKPYRCTAGKLTIGVGRNLDDRGITSDESAYLLRNDIDSHWNELIKHIPWVETLDDIRQRVMLDMAFNMGIFGLLTFHQTLGHIKVGNYALASSAMLESKWARQVGQRAKRLATMMKTGKDYIR
jgi:lysozyme